MKDEHHDKEQSKDPLREHEADGIREYDNPMPRWWIGLFYVTIFFAFWYFLTYQVFPGGNSLEQDLVIAKTKQEELKQKSVESAPPKKSFEEILKDPSSLAAGKEVFATTCVPCHGAHGEGTIGPNLTDDYWLHGWQAADILKSIKEGIPAKGMPAWGAVLGDTKVELVAAYVLSLRGSNPPNPKASQGVKMGAP